MKERGTSGSEVVTVSSGALGERVQELRRRRGLTLEALAERSGVSRAMLSKVERGEKNPTLVVVAKVAEGLGTSLRQLVGIAERREVVLVPRDEQLMMHDPATGFERRQLSPTSGGRGVEFVRSVIPQGSTSGGFPPHRREVEGYLVVEKGRLRAILVGAEYLLEEGDALYFDADVLHRFDNDGEGECSYYLVLASKKT